ncbi:hypothetical protein MYX64_12780, partial [Nitrospinae bacterium AH_259_B05_G02_I21]|nr:hypothetical protein [Nitrospinae bacterium AH_259_B05_G02_I21]
MDMDAQSLGNVIAGLGFTAAAVALGFTALETRRNTATRRGMLFKELYEPFFSDDQLRLVFDLIEKRQRIFEPGFGVQDNREESK